MATVNLTVVNIRDSGGGVNVEAEITVMVRGIAVKHMLTTGDLGLTAQQVANLQGAVDAVRTRCINITKTDFAIP